VTPFSPSASWLAAIEERGPVRWTNLPPAWVLVLVVAGLVLFVRAVYRRERATLRPLQRAGLAALRVAAILLPLLALFGPYQELQRKAVEKSRLVVLVDTSASMKTKDRYAPESEQRLEEALAEPGKPGPRDLTRLEIVQRALGGKGGEVLRTLADRFVLHVLAFDEDVRSLGSTDPALPSAGDAEKPAEPLAALVAEVDGQTPRGARTRIGAALRSVQREFLREDRPLAGVWLVSDGRDNADERPEDVLAAAGKEASDLRVTTVGLGDPRRAKNVRVDRVIAKSVVLVQDEVGFQAVLRHKGFANLEGVEVSMSITQTHDAAGKAVARPYVPPQRLSTVLSRRVRLGGEDDATTAALRAEFKDPGTFAVKIEVKLPEAAAREDATREDDVRVHTLRVMDQRIRVLLADYTLRHESWFLKNLLVRESTHPGDPRRVDAQVWIQSFDPEVAQPHGRAMQPLRAFPATRAEIFSYDVIVLGDVAWRILGGNEERSKEILALLKEFVAEGGGIAFVAGVDRNPDTFLDTPLQDLLPILARSGDRAIEASSTRPFRVAPTEAGRNHPILSVVPDATAEDVDRLWRERDGWDWYWMYHAPGGLKPGAFALARVHGVSGPEFRDERQEPLAVFAAMTFGKGRVFYSAVDQIYRIRKEHGDAYYGAFWDETIRWLATYRLLGGNKRFKIFTDKPRYFVGETATVTVEALDSDYRPLGGEALTGVQVEDPDGRRLLEADDQPRADPEAPGVFRTTVRLLQSGTYRAWVDPPDRSAGSRAEETFEARFATKEDQDTLPDHALLEAIAKRTGGSGPHPPWELARLAREVPERSTERILDREELPLWDSGWVLLAAVLLLTLEWALRKRFQMI
jgi:hypothetical protein